MRAIVTITVNSNGIFQESKTANCNTVATKNNLNEAPIVREIKKKEDQQKLKLC